MDFGFDEEQTALRSSFRDFLAGQTPISHTREIVDQGSTLSRQTWAAFSRLGWLGLNVPEAQGGSGLGMLEMVLVMEESGAVVLPGPLFSSACLGVATLARSVNTNQTVALLKASASGAGRVTVAWGEPDGSWWPSAEAQSCSRAVKNADGFSLNGRKLFVPDVEGAAAVVMPAIIDGAVGLFLVPTDTPGLAVREMVTIDLTRKLYEVTMTDVVVPGNAQLQAEPGDEALPDSLLALAQLSLAAEMIGAADAALTMSVEYAKIREQFGKPIGSFQAIQHKCADMSVVLENARSLVYYAAWAYDGNTKDAITACTMAKSYAGEACTKVVQDAIQVHGGIGFTREHDLHFYLKRVRADAACYGDAYAGREVVAKAMGL